MHVGRFTGATSFRRPMRRAPRLRRRRQSASAGCSISENECRARRGERRREVLDKRAGKESERMKRGVCAALLSGIFMALTASAPQAETIKIGLFRGTSSGGAIYIAMDKGYFAAEGLTAELTFFDAGEPIAVATVSGDVDFGAAGVSAGLYNLAGKGALKIIGGVNRDVPGFRAIGYYVSNRAYDAGVRTLRDFAGHSAGVTTVGSTYHYTLGLLEQHGGVAPKAVRVLALQSIPNIASALTGGQADIAVLPVPYATPAEKRGNYKLLGYVSDVAPWQVGVIWTATKTVDTKP